MISSLHACCRRSYFKLISAAVAQIVLPKSGYDPDFDSRRVSIDIEAIIGLSEMSCIYIFISEFEKLFVTDSIRNDEGAAVSSLVHDNNRQQREILKEKIEKLQVEKFFYSIF